MNKIAIVSLYPLIIALNVNGLNAPIKRKGQMDKKTKSNGVLLIKDSMYIPKHK